MGAEGPTDDRRPPRDVIIVGASLAGLFAAVAAAGDGRRVTVLERDVLPDDAVPRPGVPQGPQPHVLLRRGLEAAEDLLPGLRSDLLSAGAVPIDPGAMAWLSAGGWSPMWRSGFELLSLTRPLLEDVVRRRVSALAGVRILQGTTVSGLERSPGGRWDVVVTGGTAGPALGADLVIDASGRGSRLPAWLTRLGVDPGRVEEVDARLGYATRAYQGPATLAGPPGIVVQQTPTTPVGGGALPVEGGRWLVTVVGTGARRPPRDAEEFTAYLAEVRDPVLADLAAAAVPAGAVAVHRQTGNRRHRYDVVRRWPPGLLVVGDALCAFNPVYGQGVTVAACQAVRLRAALQRGAVTRDAPRVLRSFSRAADLPWAISTGEDLRHATSTGSQSRVQALLGAWGRQVDQLATHGDTRAVATLAGVHHLVDPPTRLLSPRLVAAVVRARLRGPGPSTPRPVMALAVRPPAPR